MNGIRQYFPSVAKEVSPVEEEEPTPIKKGNLIVSNMESVIKSVKKQSKSKKKRKDKVSGDGEIVDISNILSTSLKFISPTKSGQNEVCNGISSPEEEPSDDAGKKNVFLVMMQARAKNKTSQNRRGTEDVDLPDQEITQKRSKKRKRSPASKEDTPKDENPRKPSRRKKLFELEIETVDFPRKIKDKAEDPQVTDELVIVEEKIPKKDKSEKKKNPKRRKLFEQEVETVEIPVPEIQAQKENLKNLENEKQTRQKRKARKVEIEEIVLESDTDSPSQRPRRSCRQKKMISYSLDSTFLSDESSPEKTKTPKRAGKSKEIISIDVDSPKKPLKLAPIFMKRPEIDPEVLKAKQDFLMSGIPEKMRQIIEKQKAIEELFEFNIFPTVAHVTQIHTEMDQMSWTDGKISLKLSDEDFLEDFSKPLQSLTFSLIDKIPEAAAEVQRIPRKDYLTSSQQKSFLKKLSNESGNFPWKRAFQFFKRKQEEATPIVTIPDDPDDSLVIIEETFSPEENLLLTEKYRPESSEDFLLNSNPVEELKKFLLDFQNGTFESLHDPEESSGSNFSNSCCVVLSGPCGSGKSASVAAVASELNINILEINAGQRRSGKKILQELQEATKSHKISQKSADEHSNGFSVILVEDAEITFEQDDGFISALHQIVSDSKRPVILTTSDHNCEHLQRFIAKNVIHFEPPEPEEVSKYFTVMSLAEGLSIPEGDILNRYLMNHRDFRRTGLELEFFIKSGGDLRTESDDYSTREDHRDLNKEIVSSGLREQLSFETLSANSSSWLEASSSSIDNLADFYDIMSTSEIFNSKSDEKEITESLVDKALSFWQMDLKSYDHFKTPRTVERSCLCSMTTGAVASVDCEPILRNICRSEQEKAARERKSSRFYHYLRQIVSSSSNEFFSKHCKIFQAVSGNTNE